MDPSISGMAYFSTKGGKWPPRPAPAIRSRLIVRGDLGDRDARDEFVVRLRKEFPEKCKEIKAIPGPSRDVYEYFDGYDVYVHGLHYLDSIIDQIAWDNVGRIKHLDKFVDVWKMKNEDLFWSLTQESTLQEVFGKDDFEAHDEEWLEDALERIWLLRDCYAADST